MKAKRLKPGDSYVAFRSHRRADGWTDAHSMMVGVPFEIYRIQGCGDWGRGSTPHYVNPSTHPDGLWWHAGWLRSLEVGVPPVIDKTSLERRAKFLRASFVERRKLIDEDEEEAGFAGVVKVVGGASG